MTDKQDNWKKRFEGLAKIMTPEEEQQHGEMLDIQALISIINRRGMVWLEDHLPQECDDCNEYSYNCKIETFGDEEHYLCPECYKK